MTKAVLEAEGEDAAERPPRPFHRRLLRFQQACTPH